MLRSNVFYKKLVLSIIVVLFFNSSLQSQTNTIKNPVLTGFYSDPSICRIGEDYYLVNSSFEMYPGLPIHHSKDLVNWELIGYGVSDPNKFVIGKEGKSMSNDIFAPTIRFHNGLFYIICTGVGGQGNFFITATDPAGEWSAPNWIEGSEGIDPEIFWDTDGKSYYLGQSSPRRFKIEGKVMGAQWPGQSLVYMQEIDLKASKLIGERKILTHGHATNARWTEGPHLFKLNGKYLLMVAEGGTDLQHATTVFHSDTIWGPYVPEYTNPVLSHRHLGKSYPVWAVGHTDLVQTQKGDWWAVMHAKRKIDGVTILARETCITPVAFEGNTPVFNPGVGKLSMDLQQPNLPWTPVKKLVERDEFKKSKLELYWNFIRTPKLSWHSIKKGELIVKTRPNSISKFENPSFIGRRVESHKFSASTLLKFNSKKENERAGIVIYRNKDSNFQLLKNSKSILLINTAPKNQKIVAEIPYSKKEVVFKLEVDGHNKATFFYGENEKEFKQIGEPQDLYYLSDEAFVRYNGLYVGMYTSSEGEPSKLEAKFSWFEYTNQ
ncbi:alpha-N-arabinofuranosidase [Lutibacter oricola]|uniref:Alpha-N-arabinofuranosidase n=1 Tax=Lutibacter oricola TaxID=762486 RepID=A0A1H2WVW0_9FLAO|nr:glycoside hydrolase family 43 protein [Lutibacter oricola]SDW84119.1 alpha-N-arabinofuranosidase [Lutibacter oricola]